MTTSAANPRVQALHDAAQAKADECAGFLEGLTPEQTATTTEIGWTVAATAAHLAGGTGFAAMQLKQLKQGKAPTVPLFVVNAANFVTTRRDRNKALDASIEKLRTGTGTNLAALETWTDAELDTRYKKPYYGSATYGEALRYTFIGHLDEHLGQIKRALKM
jgi:hypothetical protein